MEMPRGKCIVVGWMSGSNRSLIIVLLSGKKTKSINLKEMELRFFHLRKLEMYCTFILVSHGIYHNCKWPVILGVG